MMKLERLRIDKFRNVKPGSDIRFADGFNIVLGRNGTGKTTLLDLISRIVRWDFRDLEREEFAIAYELSAGGSCIEVELSNRRETKQPIISGTTNSLMMQTEAFAQNMRARVTVKDKVTDIEYADERIRVGGKIREVPGASSSILSDKRMLAVVMVFADDFLFIPSLMSSVLRFDESLDLFRETWDSRRYPGDFLYFSGGSISHDNAGRLSVPTDVQNQVYQWHQSDPALTSITITNGKLSFLSKALQSIGFVSAELRIDVLGRRVKQDYGSIDLGNMIARFFFADGGFITQDRLSYGQKRLLMFYYYLASNPDIVIADELVNGLHHQWITACIDEIGERQAFLTSQNPLLLDYLPFSSAEQVRKSFVLCTSELDENKKPVWTWSNMTEEAANEFFSAYQVGIEHVSEILQSQGLF